jgi:hypothetical protein
MENGNKSNRKEEIRECRRYLGNYMLRKIRSRAKYKIWSLMTLEFHYKQPIRKFNKQMKHKIEEDNKLGQKNILLKFI